MKVILEKKESEDYFYNAMCNGFGYFGGYGLSLDYKDSDYAKAKTKYKKDNGSDPCREDIYLGILKIGGSLIIIDEECEGENNSTITLKDVHDRVQLTPHNHLMDMINEGDDAITADCILQTVFFGDVIFG
jgi:hypothetical protein